MNLQNFYAVFRVATYLSGQGEPLVLRGESRTVAVRPAHRTDEQEIEVIELGEDALCREPKFFTSKSFEAAGLARLEVPSAFQSLVDKSGEQHAR